MTATAVPLRRALLFSAETDERSVDDRLHELMRECERPVYGYLVHLVRDTDVAQDCFQDTFLRAHEALCRGQSVSRQWVFRVAHNRAMDEFRRKRRVQPDLDSLEHLPAKDRCDGHLDVQAVMERLDPLDRDVLHLFILGGYKTEEIGVIIGASGAAVRQRLYRARERFRALYGEAA